MAGYEIVVYLVYGSDCGATEFILLNILSYLLID
jgi:hypothetical protein